MRENSFDIDKRTRQLAQTQQAMSEQMGRMSEAWLKAAARAGNEATGLMGRRARAYAEIPGRLGLCKSPMDLQAEQVRFWQTCAQDYAQATRSIVEAWSSVMPMAALGPQAMSATSAMLPAFWMFGVDPSKSREAPHERDTLTMPERDVRVARAPASGTTYDVPQPGARRPAA